MWNFGSSLPPSFLLPPLSFLGCQIRQHLLKSKAYVFSCPSHQLTERMTKQEKNVKLVSLQLRSPSFTMKCITSSGWFPSFTPLFILSPLSSPLLLFFLPSHVRRYVTLSERSDCEPLHHVEEMLSPFSPYSTAATFHRLSVSEKALLHFLCLYRLSPKMVRRLLAKVGEKNARRSLRRPTVAL